MLFFYKGNKQIFSDIRNKKTDSTPQKWKYHCFHLKETCKSEKKPKNIEQIISSFYKEKRFYFLFATDPTFFSRSSFIRERIKNGFLFSLP